MIRELRLGNFKAFGPTQTIPIRPITLLYGPNSAGKSSIIHALAMLHEAATERNGDVDVHRTTIGGKSIDLGGFRQYVHRRDPSRRLEIGFRLTVEDVERGHTLAPLLAKSEIEISLSYGETVDNEGQPVVDSKPVLQGFELATGGAPFLRMSRRPSRARIDTSRGDLRVDLLDPASPIIDAFLRAVIEAFTTVASLQEADLPVVRNAITTLVPDLRGLRGRFLPWIAVEKEGVVSPVWGLRAESLHPVSKGNRQADLEDAVRLFLPRRLADFLRELDEAIAGLVKPLEYLGPMRTYPPRHLAFAESNDGDSAASGEFAWYLVLREPRLRKMVNDWLGADFMQTPYELAVRSYTSDEELRRFLDRATVKLHAIDEVDENGDPLPDELDLEATHRQLGKQVTDFEGLLYDVFFNEGFSSGQRLGDQVRELVLIDKRTHTAVSHRDVGIGVSQVLPVLVHALASEHGLIAIEQPEIHLHPALQAELADAFLESADLGTVDDDGVPDGGATFLLETHSEHLLLRIMRRIRETTDGTLPEGKRPIRPTDVAVLYVDPKGANGASIVREMPLDERGNLIKPWPGGFFEEGMREMF